MEFRIGTSGWHYKHWRGNFYPPELPVKRWFSYYREHFDCVEINNSFYRLPTVTTMEQWANAAPAGFRFAIKASRYLTHFKRLLDPAEPIHRLAERIAPLGEKLGPVLFQLPPRWGCDAGRLRAFLQQVPRDWRCVFEFRDPSWEHPEIERILEDFNAAYCMYELAAYRSPLLVTADFAYVRLHGPSEHKYAGSYDDAALRWWVRYLERTGVREAWVFFDNDQAAYAVHNAMRLKQLAARRVTTRSKSAKRPYHGRENRREP